MEILQGLHRGLVDAGDDIALLDAHLLSGAVLRDRYHLDSVLALAEPGALEELNRVSLCRGAS